MTLLRRVSLKGVRKGEAEKGSRLCPQDAIMMLTLFSLRWTLADSTGTSLTSSYLIPPQVHSLLLDSLLLSLSLITLMFRTIISKNIFKQTTSSATRSTIRMSSTTNSSGQGASHASDSILPQKAQEAVRVFLLQAIIERT